MKKFGHDENTRKFYQIPQVASDYEAIRFSSRAGHIGDSLQKRAILSLLDPADIKGAKVLDVGCGTGRFSRIFMERDAKVIGVDASMAMLNEARSRSQVVNYAATDALYLPFTCNEFDIAISVNVFNHLASYEQAIGEMCRVSKKIILGLPNKKSILLLAYIYRSLKGYNSEYGGYTVKHYNGAPMPYSIYFSANDLERILIKNGMRNIHVTGCLFTFFLPNIATGLVARFDQFLTPHFGRFGAFIVISGEK